MVDFYGLSRCVLFCGDIRNEKNNRVFRLESDPSNLWSLIRFHISLWASTSKTFCNYFIGFYFGQLEPFPKKSFLSEACLFVPHIILYILNVSCFICIVILRYQN